MRLRFLRLPIRLLITAAFSVAGMALTRAAEVADSTAVVLSPEARRNLGLEIRPLEPTSYWKVIEIPGVVVDRPGVSDRGVTAPIAGTITKVHAFPGTTVSPDAPLFTIRLVSDPVHKSQLELFKAMREIDIARRQLKRLEDLTKSGALAQTRIFEIENQLDRMQATVEAYRQDLVARGLSQQSIDDAAAGQFVTEIVVRAPVEPADRTPARGGMLTGQPPRADILPFAFEVHSLDIELGQHVEAGMVLMHLADHRRLLVEGRGFKDDMPLVQEAARQELGVEIDADEADRASWPAFHERIPIDHISNTVDPVTRTFSFFLPLENQLRTYQHNAETRVLWRFRPGSRLRLRVAVERLDDVFVLPREAVVHEGPRVFLFRQSKRYAFRTASIPFERNEVRVVHEDRLHVVLAGNNGLPAGSLVAWNSAAAIERIRKSQRGEVVPTNVHVHADGTVHEGSNHGAGAGLVPGPGK
jgi:cobalt-zinc-cadmium efflux system membrane fusion protein